MDDGKIKVLYIAGMTRSGSTILGNVLGQIDGFFHPGELWRLWDNGLIENRPCACGLPVRECVIWSVVLEKAFGGPEHVDAEEMVRLYRSNARTAHLPLMLMPRFKSHLRSRLQKYLDNLDRLYRAIQSTVGSKLIVDTSKSPSYGYLLQMLPAIDLYVVHLIRDPRAVAYSWLRKKPLPIYVREWRQNPIRSSLLWILWNLAAEALWKRLRERYLRLRYEDFASQPQQAIRHILDFLGEDASHLPFVSDCGVLLKVNHTVVGNPNRFNVGRVELHPDQEWKTKMRKRDGFMVRAVTWPLLSRYGYS